MTTLPDMLHAYRANLTEYVAPVAAEAFIDGLSGPERKILNDWLREQAPRFIAEELARLDRCDRAKARHRRGARAFAEAGEEPTGVDAFEVFLVISDDNLRRRVGDMTAADHRFVSDCYEASGRRALMLAEFHRAVAKKCGTKRTRDVMDEDIYVELLGSVTGE